MKTNQPAYKSLSLVLVLLFSLSLLQCKTKTETTVASSSPELKLSLAQWSIHRALENGTLKAEDFASIAKNDYGISAVEYVNSLYKEHGTDQAYWESMRSKADSLGVKSLLIMVDAEGDLGNPNAEERKQAVENHFKWVDAASILGCHSIRINAFGDGTKEEVQTAMIDALKQLCTYAKSKNINVLIENHGLYSSDGKWTAEIMKQVNMPNCGTLPDFGNWCLTAKWGSTEDGTCESAYDFYQGVSEMLPFAKGVSAKSYEFNEEGNEEFIDYDKMLKIVKQSDFKAYIGIEYEGNGLSEHDGILATKKLIEKLW
uniref:sugar phosphate isomerase/epimerase family protein n=1 Tax=Roseivirga sp. TaxID=1964215 RepID=UPI004047837B